MFASKYINIFASVICVVVCTRNALARRKKERKKPLEVILVGSERRRQKEEKNQNLSWMYNEENFDFSNSFHYHQHTKFISMSSTLVLMPLPSSPFPLHISESNTFFASFGAFQDSFATIKHFPPWLANSFSIFSRTDRNLGWKMCNVCCGE